MNLSNKNLCRTLGVDIRVNVFEGGVTYTLSYGSVVRAFTLEYGDNMDAFNGLVLGWLEGITDGANVQHEPVVTEGY